MHPNQQFCTTFLDVEQRYRTLLCKQWDERGRAVWLMMNPSYANADISDRTVDRAIHFSKQHDCGGIVVINLWPMVDPKSAKLWKAVPTMDPAVILANTQAIRSVAKDAKLRVVAFGDQAGRKHREHVEQMLEAFGGPFHCLDTTKRGWPKHPMARGRARIRDDQRLQLWSVP